MSAQKIIISPKTKVGELLDSFPDLETVLIAMSPAFEKLKNPILRKTVARVATLQQIAVVGGLNVDDIVNSLRKEAGQSGEYTEDTEASYLSVNIPDWFDESKIINRMDASPVINAGGSPMSEILHKTSLLKEGEIFELLTPFVPAPIIDILKSKGYIVCTIQRESRVISYIKKI